MTKRKDHNNVLEQRSHGRLRAVLAEWVVNALAEEDYAFDFEIRPTVALQEPAEVVPTPSFAQVKATRWCDSYDAVWFDFDVDFLVEDCLQSSVPVVLFIYEEHSDELNWWVAQHHCWDVLDESSPGWRDQDTKRIHIERDPLTDMAGRNSLRAELDRARRRITTRDFVATARREPFDPLPGSTLATTADVRQYKRDLLEKVEAFVDADRGGEGLAKAMEVYKLPEDDEATLDAIDVLLTHRETTDPAIAFAKIRFASDGLQLAEELGHADYVEQFEATLEDAWEFVAEQFVGARYHHRDAGHELLILDIDGVRIPVGGANVLANVQWGAGELGRENAHAIAANDEYERLESGELRLPREDACESREHAFDVDTLRTAPDLATCSACGLSRRVVREWLGQPVPDVCEECASIRYDVEYRVVPGSPDVGLCADCRE